MPAVLLSVAILALLVATLVDIIRIDNSRCRYMPKVVWLLLAILLPFLGSVLWWAIGREYEGALQVRLPRRAPRQSAPAPAPLPPSRIDTRSTEQQIADLDREIEEWRLREEIAKRKQERGDDAAASDR